MWKAGAVSAASRGRCPRTKGGGGGQAVGAGGVSGVAGRSRAVFRGSASGSRPRRSPGGGEGPEAAVPGGPGPGEDSGGRSRPPAHVRGVPRHASPGMPRRRLRGSAVARSRGAFPGAEGAWPRRAPLFAGNALPLAEPSHPGNPGNPRTFLPGCGRGGGPDRSGSGEDSGGRSRSPAHLRGVPRHVNPGRRRRRRRLPGPVGPGGAQGSLG